MISESQNSVGSDSEGGNGLSKLLFLPFSVNNKVYLQPISSPICLFSCTLPVLAASPALFNAMEPGTSAFPPLPPIDLMLGRSTEDAQIAAANVEVARLTKIQKKLMKLKRSKVQQQQLQSLLYVFSPGLPVWFFMMTPLTIDPECQ